MTIWQIKWAYYGMGEIQKLLRDGWEPFAVTVIGEGINTANCKIWFRKPKEK